jgi:hypothetical protein
VKSPYGIYKGRIVLTVVFIAGSGMYHKAEPQGNILLDVCKCIGVSIDTGPNHDVNADIVGVVI